MIQYTKQNDTYKESETCWTIQLGFCLPKTCSNEEIMYLTQRYFDENYLELQKMYHMNMMVTNVKSLREDIFVIIIILVLLSIAGTIYDVRQHHREKNLITSYYNQNPILNTKNPTTISTIELVSKSSSENLAQPNTFGDILKCFSIYSNTKNLVKTKLSPDSVGCIHGLRFLGMLWVIAVHGIYFQADYISNVPYAFRLSENFAAQILSNSTYCVDTYLFLSGFLVTYLYYKANKPQEKSENPTNYLRKFIEFCMMYFNRFVRLTPPYLAILLFADVIYTLLRQTSSLTSSEMPDVVCEKYWWRNLLYINNLFPRKDMCLSWSWYLSLDTQFFTITTFLAILSLTAFKVTAAVTFLLIFTGIGATIYKSYSIGYIPTLDEQLLQLDAIYDLPWNRIGPYLVGAITGYLLQVHLQHKLALTKVQRIVLWVAFPLINLWILFTIYTRQLSVELSALYMGVSRTLWGVGIAWIVVACCTGNAQALQKFLSFRGFIPLSRMTYCAYLLNPIVATMLYLGSEQAFNSSLSGFGLTLSGVTLLTFFMSYVFCVLVESPFILLTKMAFKKITRGKGASEKKP
ncbi:hypothetical protein NQ317_014741 [Molorchus minor]|uniref:Acyltransferase 3 domain-containing protein n=1 Tax=Molorchus minor TaxID=1323400 RepID=A0ABQ9J3Q3_9CUCU|nr:hypothetical protein NQ317_014741 [Molorchus minor]